MRNRELEYIACLLAVDGEAMTDGEILTSVWALLESWNVYPDAFRDRARRYLDAYDIVDRDAYLESLSAGEVVHGALRLLESWGDVPSDPDPTPAHGIVRPSLSASEVTED